MLLPPYLRYRPEILTEHGQAAQQCCSSTQEINATRRIYPQLTWCIRSSHPTIELELEFRLGRRTQG